MFPAIQSCLFEKGKLSQVRFLPVQEDEDHDDRHGFLANENYDRHNRSKRTQRLSNHHLWTILNVAILCITLVVNSTRFLRFRDTQAMCSNGRMIDSDAMSDAIRATSSYSPILNDIGVKTHDVTLNGTLWPSKNPSWMRAEPGPETDDMWERYESKGAFHVTGADILAMGGDPETAVKFPEHFGLGDDAYMASFDMLHKTHCLNELRKMTFEDYGRRAPIVKAKRHGRLWWVHLRHCVDMLMQDQICHADADLVHYRWVDAQANPWPIFSIRRCCRDWDQIYRWGAERFVDLDKLANMTKDVRRQVPFERGYYEMYGFNHSELFPDGEGYEW